MEKNQKNILGTQPKALAGWPKRLRLVQATPWADFAVLDVQLCSTITQLFSRGWTILLSTIIYDLDSRIAAKYSKCQTTFYSIQVSFRFHSLRCYERLVSLSICTKIRTRRFHRTEHKDLCADTRRYKCLRASQRAKMERDLCARNPEVSSNRGGFE